MLFHLQSNVRNVSVNSTPEKTPKNKKCNRCKVFSIFRRSAVVACLEVLEIVSDWYFEQQLLVISFYGLVECICHVPCEC